MRLVINIVLILLAIFFAYMLYSGIQEPIAFKKERVIRRDAVVDQLKKVRTAQEFFRNIKGGFAPNFDTLSEVLREDSFMIVKVVGDPDDPNFTGEILYDTTLIPAIDTIKALHINLDSLKYVPYGEGKTFNIFADTTTYQKIKVNVVEVGTRWADFMGEYGSKKYSKYDQRYDPNKMLKFGSKTAPNLAGNWEQ